MMTPSKYKRQYYMPPVKCMKWAEKEYVDKAPIWCSVDPVSYTHLDVYKRQPLHCKEGRWQ